MTWDGRIRADARAIPLADGCVQMVCTSPPYFGLRDYSMCACRQGRVQHESSTMAGSQAGTPSEFSAADPNCLKCNGTGHDRSLRESQLGLERTPQEYVDSMLTVFREVWRVLKPDGVLWLNLGDSYCTTAPGTRMAGNSATSTLVRHARLDAQDAERAKNVRPETPPGLKPKDLVGIPWRVAFALQADGWFLRSDVIWSKPNPMPESVTDRPTKAHEYIFLLTKNERYYYDHAAIAEISQWEDHNRFGNKNAVARNVEKLTGNMAEGADKKPFTRRLSAHMEGTQGNEGERWRLAGDGVAERGYRNKRSVWNIATSPYPEAHYATFPEEIPEICIRAGSKPGDLILDPFFGSGTVGRVAERLNRRWVGIDLGYQSLQAKRVRNVQRELVALWP